MSILKKTLSKTAEVTVLTMFSGLFAGYALAVYPFELIAQKQTIRAQKVKIKYASSQYSS
ncbi:hypothetical protein [Pseudalkalibacillus salsuginis]|uniref:hypothetical protein n=1 Tax=Pseudalkalibacillus salsuginis TaxID=2910972 RepID=UPI001F21633C|nr:hypothetical protein [Pseudalkalibacillus salsuginis]MCF6408835.1 hypothetical protein [Pseudalkalibacillus salsuginis]